MNNFTINHRMTIFKPRDTHGYAIAAFEWEEIKKRVREVKDKSSILYNIGMILLTLAFSAFVNGMEKCFVRASDEIIDIPELIAWFVFAGSLVCGLVVFTVGKHEKTLTSKKAEEVVRFMEMIEKKYTGEDEL